MKKFHHPDHKVVFPAQCALVYKTKPVIASFRLKKKMHHDKYMQYMKLLKKYAR